MAGTTEVAERTPKELGDYAKDWAKERLEPYAMQLAEGRYGEAHDHERARLSQFGLTTMLDCPARGVSMDGFDGWDIHKANRWLAVRGLALYLTDDSVTTIQQGVRTAMSRAMAEADPDSDYVDSWMKSQPPSVRALLAARAGGWIGSLVETVRDGDDEAEALRPPKIDGPPMRYYYPGRALYVEARVDAYYGRANIKGPSAETVLVHVGMPAVVDQVLAYEATAVTIARGFSPGFIAAVMAKSGVVRKIPVDTALIETGLGLCEQLAAIEVKSNNNDFVGVARNASYFGCRSCAVADTCSAKAEMDAQPTVYGGLRA